MNRSLSSHTPCRHISFRYFCYPKQRLTVPLVDQFIADLKDSVKDAKIAPSGKGSMVAVYGMSFQSSSFSLHVIMYLSASSMLHDLRNPSFAQNLHEESIEVMASIRVFEFEHRFHHIIISSC